MSSFPLLNPGARRGTMFHSIPEYRAFERVLREAGERLPMRLLSDAVMSTHRHLVPCPEGDFDMPRDLHRLTRTHAQPRHLAQPCPDQGGVRGGYGALPASSSPHQAVVSSSAGANLAQLWRHAGDSLGVRAGRTASRGIPPRPGPIAAPKASMLCLSGRPIQDPALTCRLIHL